MSGLDFSVPSRVDAVLKGFQKQFPCKKLSSQDNFSLAAADPISFCQLIHRCKERTEDSLNYTTPACEDLLYQTVITKLEAMLTTELPKLKKRIIEHNGLRKDLESYRRRVRKLQQSGKDEGDKVCVSFGFFFSLFE